MKLSVSLLALLLTLLTVSPAHAQAPIVALDGVQTEAKVFEDSSRKEPLELKSKEEAAKYLKADSLEKLAEQIDFEKQVVLIFAWRGSGQDKMDYLVAESFPEQITFNYHPGLTRDLRPHVYVYALRSNVSWSVK